MRKNQQTIYAKDHKMAWWPRKMNTTQESTVFTEGSEKHRWSGQAKEPEQECLKEQEERNEKKVIELR